MYLDANKAKCMQYSKSSLERELYYDKFWGQEKLIKKLKLGMAIRVYNPSMQEHGGVEAKRFQI